MAQTQEGAAKIMAGRLAMSLDDYQRRNATEKWCTGCKGWHPRSSFGRDASRSDGLASSCWQARKKVYDRTYVKAGRRSRAGVLLAPTRDGDKKQARARVNHAVDIGQLPDPNALPCADCGHAHDGEKRHEYDHYMGYSAEHQMSVQAVCSVCHRRREIERAAAENKLPANAKLDHEKVRTIRSSTEPTRALADALGVDVEMVRRIRTGQTYRSVR